METGKYINISTVEVQAPYTCGLPEIWKQGNTFWTEQFRLSVDEGVTWTPNCELDLELLWTPNISLPLSENTWLLVGNKEDKKVSAVIEWTDIPIYSTFQDSTIMGSYIYLYPEHYINTDSLRIQVASDASFSTLLIDTIQYAGYSNKLILENQLDGNGTKYFLRLRGEDGSYTTGWSDTSSFLYGIQFTSSPTLLTPENGKNIPWGTLINCTWSEIPEANIYRVHFSNSEAFTDTVEMSTGFKMIYMTGLPSLSTVLTEMKTVYWRVRAEEIATMSIGPWSDGFSLTYGEPIATDNDFQLPEDYVIQDAYPNPFNPMTNIKYGLPETSDVQLTVYDITGREVVVLMNIYQPAGWYTVQWNGTTQDGTLVGTGMYFARFQAGSYSKVIKMLYLE